MDKNSLTYERISFDEIFSNLLIFAQIKKKIATIYKKPKLFSSDQRLKLIKNLSFTLTKDQEKIIKEIDDSLKSDKKMIRLLQGDVGSGKTINFNNYWPKCCGCWLPSSINVPYRNIGNSTFKFN